MSCNFNSFFVIKYSDTEIKKIGNSSFSACIAKNPNHGLKAKNNWPTKATLRLKILFKIKYEKNTAPLALKTEIDFITPKPLSKN